MKTTLTLTFDIEDIKPTLKRPPAKLTRDLERAIRERLDDLAFQAISWGYEIEAKLLPAESGKTDLDSETPRI